MAAAEERRGPRRSGFSLILCALCILSLTMSSSGCTAVRSILAYYRSTDHFISYTADPRVLYETGAETFAPEVAAALPSAIQKVENGQYLPFSEPARVYLCVSEAGYHRLTGTKARATTTRKVFLSRALLAEPPIVPMYLAHELSHLHLLQRLGILSFNNLPAWFKEGLAALVSGGGGAQMVTDAQAIEAINQGQTFIPDEGRNALVSLFFPRYGSYWHLENQMFYHQAMLFVGFMREKDEAAFRRMLLDIQSGSPFAVSLEKAYGLPLADFWRHYLQEIKVQANRSANHPLPTWAKG